MELRCFCHPGLYCLVDAYQIYANSAVAVNSLLRSLFGAGFPLFAVAMYHNLGVPWAASLLAFLTLAMIPIPVLFTFTSLASGVIQKFKPLV